MDNNKYIWENDRFNKNPFKVREGYFRGFPDRMMERLNQEEILAGEEKKRFIRPWMAWVSGVAAVLMIGWFGVRTYYWKPLQEVKYQENIALYVDFYGEELHEGDLAGYIVDNKIDILKPAATEVNELIQIEPDQAEEYILESIGF